MKNKPLRHRRRNRSTSNGLSANAIAPLSAPLSMPPAWTRPVDRLRLPQLWIDDDSGSLIDQVSCVDLSEALNMAERTRWH